MILIRTITLPFAGDTWAVKGSQAGPPAGFPLAVAVAAHRQTGTLVPIRWRIIGYAAGVPVTDLTARVDALLAIIAPDAAGVRTISIGPSLVDCKSVTQPLGIRLEDSAHVGDVVAFAVPSLTGAGAATSLRIFADYGAVLQ